MRSFFTILLFLATISLMAQTTDLPTTQVSDSLLLPTPDPKYREDQFYASITYNIMQGMPKGYSQYSVSTGLGFGFLRDIPLNKKRNHAIAIGLGYSYNNIKHNLVVKDTLGANTYELTSKTAFDKNKLVLHYLELPLEFRWRTSNDTTHQFWRIYTGVKLSYLIYDKAQNEPDGNTVHKVRNDANMNKLTTGLYVAAGYNTWNFYAYYGLTPVYKNTTLQDGEKLSMHSLKLGLMFYIL
ncbi:porin family protein [Flavobacterium psychrotrophum]|uniref:porin family protein n=1 Tax=Flavobacterium psychrotrophum TaxID=2294119 RepID=UPI000E3123C8|nr:porin family protein [Flavobacterium psychrotrophum]